ncbi:ABC transporter ATP-binding protein [Planococcus lenghuensis]|uniref:ABC transporter ATP-binding protein n=1 Tax=Planococcus lenghuensis TaxID=2213202 RepID=A0A1Q2KV10_9BACL|nr:ABC transporter ATP-binding protein [Planococcus lenghuensis]AQQ52031.1 ABC transporter ATP-binding protein [Planococcus lenghuensis]
MIAITDLHHAFTIGKKGAERHMPVLKGVTLTVGQGEIAAILGKSGSGKSTLLNVVAGFMKPDSGSVHVAGQETTGLKEAAYARFRLAHFGFIYQNFQLMPGLTAFENIALPLKIKGIAKEERELKVLRLLQEVGLQDVADHYPNELSGGQQQRVSIARALVTDPPIILADEPTGSLDSETEADVLELIRSLNETWGTTFVIITHDDEVAAVAHRQYRLHDGELMKGEKRYVI